MAGEKPAKNMDGVHTGDTPPSSTSRPVIVSNRPFMTSDPMLNETTAGEDKASGEPTAKPQDEAGVPPEVSRQAKDVVPTEQVASEEQSKPEASGAKPGPEPEVTDSAAVSEEDENEEEDDPVSASLNPKVQLSAEEEAVAARDAELENLIAAGTYAVPINSVHKKRAATVTVLLLVALGMVVALDILLDMKILTLGGVPHTNLLGN